MTPVSVDAIRPTPSEPEAAAVAAALTLLFAEHSASAEPPTQRRPRLAASAELPWRFSGRDW